MKCLHFAVAACIAVSLAMVLQAEQGGARTGGAAPGTTNAPLVGGTLTPAKPDARGWGWQVKASMSPATPRPFYNKAKELLFQDKQSPATRSRPTTRISTARSRKHFDYIWFEMQHSTMSWDEVRRMMLACPGVDGAAPMVRMPDALESSIQKATDIGAVGIIVPTVDDALEARDAARFSRYPPFGRRSSGGGSFGQVWPGVNYRATINDNMLVTVMIETLEGVANAEEIAATAASTSSSSGNNDLSCFSGWPQNDPRYQDALIKVRNAALKYGKYYGNAGQQYLNGYVVSADTRMVQDGPARDGWQRPARGGGPVAARAAPADAGAARTHPRNRSRSSACRRCAADDQQRPRRSRPVTRRPVDASQRRARGRRSVCHLAAQQPRSRTPIRVLRSWSQRSETLYFAGCATVPSAA